MNLDELRAITPPTRSKKELVDLGVISAEEVTLDDIITRKKSKTSIVLNGEIDSDSEFPDDTDAEVDMSEALSILGDCAAVLELLLDPKICTVSTYVRAEVERIALEARAFYDQYEYEEIERGEV